MEFTLSIANIEFLKKEIGKSGLTYSHLMDELIDHVCCDIEQEMRNGLPFAKAYEMVKAKIGMGGLERIQHETLYLIDKKYRIMKNTMKISGVIAPILLAFGSLFKIQHWPTAGILLVIGFFLLSFVFLPSAIYVSYKEVSNRTKKWTHLTGFLGTFFLSVGFLFKIQHWPYAGIALTIGTILVCLVFLPMALNNRLRDKEDSVPKFVYVIGFAGLMLYLVAFLFKLMYWPYAAVFMLVGCVLLVFIAFPVYIYKTHKDHVHVSDSFIYIVLVLVWFVIPTALISLNLSTNVLNTTYETSLSIDTDLKFVQESNVRLLTGMKENSNAIAITGSAGELLAHIQRIKTEMVKLSSAKDAISENNEIIISRIPTNNPYGLYKTVLSSNQEWEFRLEELLKKFENEAIAVSSDAGYISVIKNNLVYKVNPADNPEGNLQLLLNKLSFFQLNICLAEQAALRRLQHAGQVPANLVQTLTIK